MRSWLLATALAIAGCGSSECIIDSDCDDFSYVCLDRQCVPRGTMSDANVSEMDAGRRDSGAAIDAGPMIDAPPDPCTDLGGAWAVNAVLGCGTAMIGYGVTITNNGACSFSVASSSPEQLALDGTLTSSETDALSGMLSPGGSALETCTGSLGKDGAIALTCDICIITLGRL